MKIAIKHRFNGSVIFETDAENLGAAVVAAIAAKADLRSANLSSADLRYADLRSANLLKLISIRTILPDGDLIAWKKLQGGVICKLRIPSDAKRIGGLVGRKCRAEFADVLEGSGKSKRNRLEYKAGERIKPDSFDPNPLVECPNGIHFFITKQEAKDYNE